MKLARSYYKFSDLYRPSVWPWEVHRTRHDVAVGVKYTRDSMQWVGARIVFR